MYAKKQGYEFIFQHMGSSRTGKDELGNDAVGCSHPTYGARHPSWCKLLSIFKVLKDVSQLPLTNDREQPLVMYVDSDMVCERSSNKSLFVAEQQPCALQVFQKIDVSIEQYLSRSPVMSAEAMPIPNLARNFPLGGQPHEGHRCNATCVQERDQATVFVNFDPNANYGNCGMQMWRSRHADRAKELLATLWNTNDPTHNLGFPWEQFSFNHEFWPQHTKEVKLIEDTDEFTNPMFARIDTGFLKHVVGFQDITQPGTRKALMLGVLVNVYDLDISEFQEEYSELMKDYHSDITEAQMEHLSAELASIGATDGGIINALPTADADTIAKHEIDSKDAQNEVSTSLQQTGHERPKAPVGSIVSAGSTAPRLLFQIELSSEQQLSIEPVLQCVCQRFVACKACRRWSELMKTCDVGRLHQLVGDERWAEFRETNSKGDCGFVQCASGAATPSDDACAKLIEQDSLMTDPEAGLANVDAEAEADTKLQPTNQLEKIFDKLQADTKADLQDATTEDTNAKVNIVADDNIKVRPKLQVTETLHSGGSPQQPSSGVHRATAVVDNSSGKMAAHISIEIDRRWAIRAGIGLALAGGCCLCLMIGVPSGPNSCSLGTILQHFGQQQHGEYEKLPSQEFACEMDKMNGARGPNSEVEMDIDAQYQDQEVCKTDSGTLKCCIHCNAKVVESKSKFCSQCGQLQ